MTQLDTDMRAAATEIIAEVGALVTLYPPIGTGFNPATGLPTGSDSAGVSIKASPPLPMREAFAAERDGVVMTDHLMFFDAVTVENAAGSIVPEPLGSVKHDGVRSPIIAVSSLWSGEQISAYEVALRF